MRTTAFRATPPFVLLLCLLTGTGTSAAEDDPRLSQKVTIRCINARLHSTIDQLSKQTGVRIRCGSNNDDWQVRDIPVEVSASDIALGKLLQAIATATHLALTSYKLDDDRVYQVWRTEALADELAAYHAQKRSWGYAVAAWEWECVANLKDVPTSVLDRWASPGDSARSRFTAISGVLASLGSETRNRVLAGEEVRVSVNGAPADLAPLIENYLRLSHEAYRRELQQVGHSVKTYGDSDFRNGGILITCSPSDGDHRPSISIKADGIPCEETFLANVNVAASVARDYVPREPTGPEIPHTVRNKTWPAVFSTKIKLDLPEGRNLDSISFGDACAAIAEATGYAVIAENFQGHKLQGLPQQIFRKFESATELGQVNADPRLTWSADERNKVLYCTDSLWPMSHRGLVPERLIDGLRRKLDDEGADLSDIAPLASLSKWQINEWIDQSADLKSLYSTMLSCDRPLWAFYDCLSAKQKEQARSAQGVRISRDRLSALTSIFAARESQYVDQTGRRTQDRWWESTERPVTAITLRLTTKETSGPGSRARRQYTLEFSGKRGSVPFSMSVPFYRTCPVYSPKREQEMGR